MLLKAKNTLKRDATIDWTGRYLHKFFYASKWWSLENSIWSLATLDAGKTIFLVWQNILEKVICFILVSPFLLQQIEWNIFNFKYEYQFASCHLLVACRDIVVDLSWQRTVFFVILGKLMKPINFWCTVMRKILYQFQFNNSFF